MSIYRTYLTKQATLIRNNEYSNASHDPVLELTRMDNLNSRYVFEIDIKDIKEKLISKEINNVESYILTFINTIRFNNLYIGKDYYDGIRDTQFTLNLYQLNEDFDLSYADVEYNYSPNVVNGYKIFPNWFNKNTNELWEIEGGINIGQKPIITSQYFLLGNEDLRLNITDYMNDVISCDDDIDKLRFLLSYTLEDESYSGDTRLSIAFHSKFTNTFYEPHLEVDYKENIQDDRYHFSLDKVNKLIFANFIHNDLENLDEIPEKVIIRDNYGIVVAEIPQENICHESKGIYSIRFMINDYPDLINFTDEWVGLKYKNNKLKNYKDKFTLYDSVNLFHSGEFSEPLTNTVANISGINYGERIFGSQQRTVFVSLKQLKENVNNYNVEYRLYSKQGNNQYDIIPYTKLNKIKNYLYFNIDTSFLVDNQYYIDIKLTKGTNTLVKSEILNFFVVKKVIK